MVQWLKSPSAKAGDTRDVGSIPGSARAPGKGHGNPHQYPCLQNSMGRGACQATVHGVAKNWTRLSTHACKVPLYIHTITSLSIPLLTDIEVDPVSYYK